MKHFLTTVVAALVLLDCYGMAQAKQATWRQTAVSIRGDKAICTYHDKVSGKRWQETNSVAVVREIQEIRY